MVNTPVNQRLHRRAADVAMADKQNVLHVTAPFYAVAQGLQTALEAVCSDKTRCVQGEVAQLAPVIGFAAGKIVIGQNVGIWRSGFVHKRPEGSRAHVACGLYLDGNDFHTVGLK